MWQGNWASGPEGEQNFENSFCLELAIKSKIYLHVSETNTQCLDTHRIKPGVFSENHLRLVLILSPPVHIQSKV